MSIRVTTLGAVQVVRGDTVLSALPSQRLRCALLIYMAVTRQAPRDRLLAMFWPEKTDDRARHALSQNIYELRRVLGDDWLEVRGEQFIAASHISIDLHAFEQSVERGDYSMALSLYRGAFLDGFYVSNGQAFDTWVESVRQRVQRHHRRARREGIRQLIDGARLKEALASARDWVALDPSDDEAQHRLIELLADTGDRAGAIRQYESYQKTLAAEELQPLDETRALVDRIRGGDVGPLPMPSAVQPARAARHESVAHIADHELAGAATGPPPPVARDEATATPGRLRLTRTWAAVIAVVLVVASAVTVLRLSAGRAGPAPVDLPPAERTPLSVAVLYLEDNSPPPGSPHLANGLTEELINQFGGLDPLLTVRSKQAVAPFRGQSVPWDSLARRLVADVLIGGNLVRADGRVRVTMQLVDGSTGNVLEPMQVEHPDGELLPLIDEIVQKVQLALRRRIGIELEQQRRRTGAPSYAALEAVQFGAYLRESGVRIAETDLAAGRRELARADSVLRRVEEIAGEWLEPTLQRSQLAEKRAGVEVYHRQYDAARAWFDTAIAHADRAVNMSRGTPTALEVRGSVRFRLASNAHMSVAETDSLYRLAEHDLNRASLGDPMRAQAFALLASIRFEQGLFGEANSAAKRAYQLDAFYRQQFENLYNIALTDFELGHDRAAANRCLEGFEQFRDRRYAYCALHVMAWGDEQIRPQPDSAWALVNAVRARGWMIDGSDQIPMLEMLVAATLVRAKMPDSARAVLDRAAARPPSNASPWIEAAVRYRLRQFERAAGILADYSTRENTLGPMVTEGRALKPVLQDTTVKRLLRPRGD